VTQEGEAAQPVILVADDEPTTRYLTRVALEQAGFSVVEAGDGNAVLAACERSLLDLLLLDVEMPEVDGISVCTRLGIGVALDDFGTGFSSLSYVARLPATTLKIDKSFIDDMPANQGRLAIVSAVISLAHALDMTVVAEGVEAEEQAKLLKELGCDEMQGFLYSRPVPIGEIEALL
jgi:sensor c-di-GMP phosphodiesterase-like protein